MRNSGLGFINVVTVVVVDARVDQTHSVVERVGVEV